MFVAAAWDPLKTTEDKKSALAQKKAAGVQVTALTKAAVAFATEIDTATKKPLTVM